MTAINISFKETDTRKRGRATCEEKNPPSEANEEKKR